jgi:dihydroorotate dehydrogenase
MYRLAKFFLFALPPEVAHKIAMKGLRIALNTPVLSFFFRSSFVQSVKFCGIEFKNKLGIAAGFDKNAEYIDELMSIGFGYVEIGTVTPLPQEGNPQPRLFRLVEDEALMNRMGFNNIGADAIVENLKKYRGKGYVIGGNIGKNKTTPNENAVDDYLICFQKLYDYVDYFVVNVSSPNTPNLRELQEKDTLIHIFGTLQDYRKTQAISKPIFLKIAPDLTESQLQDIIFVHDKMKIEALIVSNTTIDYESLTHNKEFAYGEKMGGISGKPIRAKSNRVIAYLRTLNPTVKIIGVGGIDSKTSAEEKQTLGCDLIQIYTGFIYHGTGLIKEILN